MNAPNYYDDIYNFIYSKKLNTSVNNKTNWKLVKYPILFDDKDKKEIKDKRRQNFRIRCKKYEISEDNRLYYKILNNKIIKYKIPYIFEANNLFYTYHDKNGHISVKRVVKEIKNNKFYWKTIHNDCLNYIAKSPICLKMKGGNVIKSIPIQIKTQGSLDGWKLHNELTNLTSFTRIYILVFPGLNYC